MKPNDLSTTMLFLCPLWVISGPLVSYQPNGRFWGQSDRSIRLENDILTGIYRPKAIIGSLPQSSKMPRQDQWVESRLLSLACKVLSIGDSGLLGVSVRWTAVLLDRSLGTTVLRQGPTFNFLMLHDYRLPPVAWIRGCL